MSRIKSYLEELYYDTQDMNEDEQVTYLRDVEHLSTEEIYCVVEALKDMRAIYEVVDNMEFEPDEQDEEVKYIRGKGYVKA